MIFGKRLYCLLLILCWVVPFPVCAQGQVTTLYQSVERALAFSPQLQSIAHNNQAVTYDLEQARARYGPSVDLLLGYGMGRHSDSVTRQPGADPSDTEWTSRGDATLRLTQKIYDGGETRQTISIQQAVLESANYGLTEATQAIALNAIIAHLDVFRQRELVDLAKKDLQVHQDIFQALSDIERAGAGNIADVTQTQTRKAQVRSALIIIQGDLKSAIANYKRVVGAAPGEVVFAELPAAMPLSLDDALSRAEEKNPGLLAINARYLEAEARVNLARSAYKPKFNIELNSRYNNHLDGDPSWQYSNDAMLVMRWNLFSGGQDKQAINAAISRKHQSRSDRDEKLIEVREMTTSTWTSLNTLRDQKISYHEAVASSEKTFDAYLKHYSVSRRSLLDVLNAEREYFQSARGLVNVSVDEIITAYRLLSLSGELHVLESTGVREITTDFSRLSQAIVLPEAVRSSRSEESSTRHDPTWEPESGLIATDKVPSTVGGTEKRQPAATTASTAIEIGPCINNWVLSLAVEKLKEYGFEAHETPCASKVKVTRLLEGRYPPKTAYERLSVLKLSVDAFILPEDGQLAIYVGSFFNHDNAMRYAELLTRKNVMVTPVEAEVEIWGKMLVVEPVDKTTAGVISEQMAAFGLATKIYSKSP